MMKLECLDDILIVCLFHLVIKIEFLYQTRTKHIPEMNFQVLSLNLCFVFFQAFPTTNEERLDLVLFVVLLKKMLHLEPAKRITPQKILRHRFVTGLTAVIHE